ncbi:MAG TPA: hypothetical protein VFF49_05440 [Thermodesulfobacteriota bacterium]|nr:hypothetical protein [Thermodesulfobacteriota bacterium]
MGQYEIVKEHDKKRIAPGKEILRKIFQHPIQTELFLT